MRLKNSHVRLRHPVQRPSAICMDACRISFKQNHKSILLPMGAAAFRSHPKDLSLIISSKFQLSFICKENQTRSSPYAD
jgi:hypothetical protein